MSTVTKPVSFDELREVLEEMVANTSSHDEECAYWEEQGKCDCSLGPTKKKARAILERCV